MQSIALLQFLTWVLSTNWTITSPNIKENNSLEKSYTTLKYGPAVKLLKMHHLVIKKKPHKTLFLKTIF